MGGTQNRYAHSTALLGRVVMCAAIALPFISLTAVATARSTESHSTAFGLSTRPNVLMLMTDDQTADSLRDLPSVRSLISSQGVTFTNSFVTTPLCCPSRATYLTGQYAHTHGVSFNSGPNGGYAALSDPSTTFPVALH